MSFNPRTCNFRRSSCNLASLRAGEEGGRVLCRSFAQPGGNGRSARVLAALTTPMKFCELPFTGLFTRPNQFPHNFQAVLCQPIAKPFQLYMSPGERLAAMYMPIAISRSVLQVISKVLATTKQPCNQRVDASQQYSPFLVPNCRISPSLYLLPPSPQRPLTEPTPARARGRHPTPPTCAWDAS